MGAVLPFVPGQGWLKHCLDARLMHPSALAVSAKNFYGLKVATRHMPCRSPPFFFRQFGGFLILKLPNQ
jgi:hypothetical protein